MKELDLTIAEIVQKNCQEWKQEGLQKGRREGRREGRQEGIGEILLKFLNADMSVEKVSEITGLSKQEISNFQKESKK